MTAPSVVFITGCSSAFGALMSRTLATGHHVFAGVRGVASKNAEPARGLRAWAGAWCFPDRSHVEGAPCST
jgi:NAD(P)-dependent dehydrogenase (short-subunit alcohol dehydrogenase family)